MSNPAESNRGATIGSGEPLRSAEAGSAPIAPASESRVRLERDLWLARLERRVILPVKWTLWGLTLLYWHARESFPGLPDPVLFGVFAFHFISNVGHAYLCLVSGVAERQARAFSYVSLAVDVVFVFGIFFIFFFYRPGESGVFNQDFYIFYSLLVVRGLSVLRSAGENLAFGAAITAAFAGGGWLLSVEDARKVILEPSFAYRLAILWLVFVIGWVLIAALRRQQDEVLAVREQLARNENMALLGEVSAGVAHEINNPIAIIAACAGYLKSALPPDSPYAEEAETIAAEARRCKRIVQDLLDFAAPEQSAEIRRLDLRELCDEALEALAASGDWAGKAPRIERRYDADLLMARADPHKMSQVFRNILSNAFHFAGPKGTVSIAVYAIPGERTPYVVAEIADSGPGIAKKDLPHVFTPFFSKRRGGTGLGLAIARRVTQAHGGDIEARSSRSGATFVVRLPANEGGSRG